MGVFVHELTWTSISEADFYAILNAIAHLMRGYPIGAAARHLRQRFQALKARVDFSAPRLTNVSRSLIDARNWIVLGDPAARLAVMLAELAICWTPK
jgi:hypothetical protein